MSQRKKIVIVGANFAGFAGACYCKSLLGDRHDVVVIAQDPHFVFVPSLVWIPFGFREPSNISFDVRPRLKARGIQFVYEQVQRFWPEQNQIETSAGRLDYDYLLIATGVAMDWSGIPGLGPSGFSHSLANVAEALKAREGLTQLFDCPGPAVVGLTQNAICFNAVYEFLLQLHAEIKKRRLERNVGLTFLCGHNELTNFGVGSNPVQHDLCSKLFDHYHISWLTGVDFSHVAADGVFLRDGRSYPSQFTMVLPRFVGAPAVRSTPGLGNSDGFLALGDDYRHPRWTNLYGAGMAVRIPPLGKTPIASGIPKTGKPWDQMAKVAVENIVADIVGGGAHRFADFGQLMEMKGENSLVAG